MCSWFLTDTSERETIGTQCRFFISFHNNYPILYRIRMDHYILNKRIGIKRKSLIRNMFHGCQNVVKCSHRSENWCDELCSIWKIVVKICFGFWTVIEPSMNCCRTLSQYRLFTRYTRSHFTQETCVRPEIYEAHLIIFIQMLPD